MNAHSHESAHSTKPAKQFRRAVLRGLGVVLPPLLTILFFLWIWNSVQSFVLVPLESGARLAITSFKMRDVHEFEPPNTPLVTQDDGLYFEKDGERYVRLATGDWIR
ncbi:MAG: hypothetical protein KDA60_10890, partial [Planctomycetales bacterium]|nr:hypothetical protein [Planctomycetales bacterium]